MHHHQSTTWRRHGRVWLIALGLMLSLTYAGKASDCTKTSVGLEPLTDMGAGLYKTYPGGLYPDGQNAPPSAHEAAGLALARQIQPLDASGQLDPQNGRIVLLSIGMSNTTQEFSVFRQMANNDRDRNPQVAIVDGAQGGMTAAIISNPNDGGRGTQFWTVVSQRLVQSGVTANQVQVAWIKEADARPTQPFPVHAEQLQRELALIAQILKDRFPNMKIAYYSSRIYGGYASTALNPEPYAYESGFAVKWLIEDQINGETGLNYDPARGDVNAPWLAWGPYLWADGLTPRSDGLIWECSDFRDNDGTHPSDSGRRKVADLLLNFFKTDATARVWFVRSN